MWQPLKYQNSRLMISYLKKSNHKTSFQGNCQLLLCLNGSSSFENCVFFSWNYHFLLVKICKGRMNRSYKPLFSCYQTIIHLFYRDCWFSVSRKDTRFDLRLFFAQKLSFYHKNNCILLNFFFSIQAQLIFSCRLSNFQMR